MILCGFRDIVRYHFFLNEENTPMTGQIDKHVSSVLPLNARTARIASGGGSAAYSRRRPEKVRVSGESGASGELDAVERQVGEQHPSRAQS